MIDCELFSFTQECDIPNWFAIIMELGIGGLLAGLFFWKQKKQGNKIESVVDKTQEQQTLISNLISEIKHLEEKQTAYLDHQNEIQIKSEQYAYFSIYASLIGIHGELNILKLIKEGNEQVKNENKERYIDEIQNQVREIETILNSFGGSLDKKTIWSVMMVVRNAIDKHYHLNQLDEVIGMSKDAIKKVEKFIPKSQRDFKEMPF